MARPNARAGNPAHSRRAGDGSSHCSIPSRTAPAQRTPTRCLPYDGVSVPNSRSHPHCQSTSPANSRANWGSTWHSPPQDQTTLRIADELETSCHTAWPRRALPPRNVSRPLTFRATGLAFQTCAQFPIANLLPLLPAPWSGDVVGTTQRELRKFRA